MEVAEQSLEKSSNLVDASYFIKEGDALYTLEEKNGSDQGIPVLNSSKTAFTVESTFSVLLEN